MDTKLTRPTIIIAGLAVLVLLLGLATLIAYRNRPATFTVEVTGIKGRKVLGHCYIDGVKRDMSGTIPATFTFQGRDFEYTVFVADKQPVKDVKIALFVNGQNGASCGEARGMKGSYSKTFWIVAHWMGSMADPECETLAAGYRASQTEHESD